MALWAVENAADMCVSPADQGFPESKAGPGHRSANVTGMQESLSASWIFYVKTQVSYILVSPRHKVSIQEKLTKVTVKVTTCGLHFPGYFAHKSMDMSVVRAQMITRNYAFPWVRYILCPHV